MIQGEFSLHEETILSIVYVTVFVENLRSCNLKSLLYRVIQNVRYTKFFLNYKIGYRIIFLMVFESLKTDKCIKSYYLLKFRAKFLRDTLYV